MKKYNKGETLKTSLAQQFKGCVKDYNIIFKDNDDNLGTIPNYFTDVEVIDFDCIEKKLSDFPCTELGSNELFVYIYYSFGFMFGVTFYFILC